MENIKFVSIETPYYSFNPMTLYRNIQYAIQANTHATLSKEYATWAPHLCNTQFVLFGLNGYVGDNLSCIIPNLLKNDNYGIGGEKDLDAINEARVKHMDKLLVYTDFGISTGMRSAINAAERHNITVEYRKLPPESMKHVFGQSIMSTAIPVIKTMGTAFLTGYGLINLMKKMRF